MKATLERNGWVYKIASVLLVIALMLSGCGEDKDKKAETKEDNVKVEDSTINFSWDELSYEEYLQEAMDEKGLQEEELQTLKYMGFSRAEIQTMTKEEAQKHIKAWKEFVEQYHDGLKMEYFKTVDMWENIATQDNMIWSNGTRTINAHHISEFINEMSKGNAKLLILYVDQVYELVFESGKGITLNIFSQDGTKEQIKIDSIEETEIGYVLNGTDIIIYK